MRILGYIPHPVVKITVFQLNMKYAVKLEMSFMEQTYKVRESDSINGFEAVARMVDPEFIDQCLGRFQVMSKDLNLALGRLTSTS